MSEQSFFNKLTPAEAERLAWLSEECGEVIQAIGKIQRHGYESYNPFIENGLSNREHLEKELGHLYVVLDRMYRAEDIDSNDIDFFFDEKAKTVAQFLHHQE